MSPSVKSVKRSKGRSLLTLKPLRIDGIKVFFMKNVIGDKNIYASFVFPKKVVKLSTKRNALKRKMREVIKQNINNIEPFAGIFFFNNADGNEERLFLALKELGLLKN